MRELPFPDESFDAVVSILALMHIEIQDREAVFREIHRVLRPGGRVLLGVKNGIIERFTGADRFATVDLTDVGNQELHFTQTPDGTDYKAPWNAFTPEQLRGLSAAAGLIPVGLQGNIPLAMWLADPILDKGNARDFVASVENALADISPLNELGYHLLFHAVKPAR